MERLKLVYLTVEKVLNCTYLLDKKYINNIFALNNPHSLFGESYIPLINDIKIDTLKMNDKTNNSILD